jgi:hypothetical protein
VWENAFVAVSVLVGATLDDALASLEGAADQALVDKLRDPRRTVRAQALAKVGQEVAMAVEAVTLR